MNTIFIIMHDTTYTTRGGGKPKIAFERKEDAEVMLDIFKDTTSGELKIVEVPLQAAPTVSAPQIPDAAKQWLGIGGVGVGAINTPNKLDGRIKEPAPEPYPDAVLP